MNIRSNLMGLESFTESAFDTDSSQEVLMDVANEAYQEGVEVANQIDRLFEVSYGLESIAQMCDHIGEVTVNEMCLIEVATESALVGTGLRVDDVLPGLESAQGTRVGTEGIVEVIRRIFDAIIKFLKKAWDRTKKFYKAIFSVVAKVRNAATRTRERANRLSGATTEENKIEAGASASVLSRVKTDNSKLYEKIGYEQMSKEEIVQALSSTKTKCSALMGPYTYRLIESTKTLDTAIKGFNSSSDGGNVYSAMKAIRDDAAKKLVHDGEFDTAVSPSGESRWDGIAKVSCEPTFSGKLLTVSWYNDAGASTNAEKLQKVNKSIARVYQGATDSSEQLPTDGEIDIISPAVAVDLCDDILEICDAIERNSAGKNVTKLTKAADKLKASCTKMRDRVEKKLNKGDGDDDQLQATFTAVCHVQRSYEGWTTEAQKQMSGVALAACRAILDVTNKSLSKYK